MNSKNQLQFAFITLLSLLGALNLCAQDLRLVKKINLSGYKIGEVKYAQLVPSDTSIFFIDQTTAKLYAWSKDSLHTVNTLRCHPGHNFDPFNLTLAKETAEILVTYSMAGGFWFNTKMECVGAVSPRHLHSEITAITDKNTIASFNMRGANPELVLLDKFGAQELIKGPVIVPSYPNTFFGLMHSYMVTIKNEVFITLSDGLKVYKWNTINGALESVNASFTSDPILKTDMKSNTMDDPKLFRNYINYYNSTKTPRGLFVLDQNHLLLKVNTPPSNANYEYRIIGIALDSFTSSKTYSISILKNRNVVSVINKMILTMHYDDNLNIIFELYEYKF